MWKSNAIFSSVRFRQLSNGRHGWATDQKTAWTSTFSGSLHGRFSWQACETRNLWQTISYWSVTNRFWSLIHDIPFILFKVKLVPNQNGDREKPTSWAISSIKRRWQITSCKVQQQSELKSLVLAFATAFLFLRHSRFGIRCASRQKCHFQTVTYREFIVNFACAQTLHWNLGCHESK